MQGGLEGQTRGGMMHLLYVRCRARARARGLAHACDRAGVCGPWLLGCVGPGAVKQQARLCAVPVRGLGS